MRETPSRYAGVPARVEVRQFSEVDVQDFLAYQGLPSVRRYQPGAVMTEAEASAYVVSQARQSDGIRGAWHGRAVELIVERRVIGDVGVWVPAQREHPVVGDLGFQFVDHARMNQPWLVSNERDAEWYAEGQRLSEHLAKELGGKVEIHYTGT